MADRIPRSARPADPVLVDRIGADLVAARADGVPWKILMARYDLGRTKLWEVWAAALTRTAPDKVVREHISCGQ